eukprot:GHVU01131940.1.p1 GENE.GHVU01131940.1~~GHVU01131940.1.p1  ORF type:complete len:509 (+),score=67.40 GHVU01131940.1:831-2357(+)
MRVPIFRSHPLQHPKGVLRDVVTPVSTYRTVWKPQNPTERIENVMGCAQEISQKYINSPDSEHFNGQIDDMASISIAMILEDSASTIIKDEVLEPTDELFNATRNTSNLAWVAGVLESSDPYNKKAYDAHMIRRSIDPVQPSQLYDSWLVSAMTQQYFEGFAVPTAETLIDDMFDNTRKNAIPPQYPHLRARLRPTPQAPGNKHLSECTTVKKEGLTDKASNWVKNNFREEIVSKAKEYQPAHFCVDLATAASIAKSDNLERLETLVSENPKVREIYLHWNNNTCSGLDPDNPMGKVTSFVAFRQRVAYSKINADKRSKECRELFLNTTHPRAEARDLQDHEVYTIFEAKRAYVDEEAIAQAGDEVNFMVPREIKSAMWLLGRRANLGEYFQMNNHGIFAVLDRELDRYLQRTGSSETPKRDLTYYPRAKLQIQGKVTNRERDEESDKVTTKVMWIKECFDQETLLKAYDVFKKSPPEERTEEMYQTLDALIKVPELLYGLDAICKLS